MSEVLVQLGTKGADGLIAAVKAAVEAAIKEKGASSAVAFGQTNYYLPLSDALLKKEVKTLGDCREVVQQAESLNANKPAANESAADQSTAD